MSWWSLDTVDSDTIFSRRAGEQDHLTHLERWTRDLPLPQSTSVAALEAGPCDSTVDSLNLSGVAYTRPGHPKCRAHFANCCWFPIHLLPYFSLSLPHSSASYPIVKSANGGCCYLITAPPGVPKRAEEHPSHQDGPRDSQGPCREETAHSMCSFNEESLIMTLFAEVKGERN